MEAGGGLYCMKDEVLAGQVALVRKSTITSSILTIFLMSIPSFLEIRKAVGKH
jgi:hypothetical protein